jgi:cytochrome P450
MALAFDPFSPEWRDDPYPAYRRLRDEAPVHHCPERGIYSVTRYEDVMTVLKSPELFSSRAMFTMLMNGGQEGRPPLTWAMLRFIVTLAWKTHLNPFEFTTARNLIAEDGESHSSLRAIVNRGFTPRRVEAWEDRARELVDACLAGLRRGEPFDLIADLAIPLPVTIIAEMIGVEPERRADFKRWSDLILEVATGPGRESRFDRRYADGFAELLGYLRGLARRRRLDPTDDVISAIVAEQEGEAGLTDREVVQFVMLLLVAGNETTTNWIGNAVNALLAHPRELERLAAEPDRVPAALEETLRYDTPVQVVFRNTTEDAELAGVPIPKGSYVAPYLGSANRDERRFPEPDHLDLDRDTRGHVGFGFGKHFCLGASLARLEARVALEALAPELPRLARTSERLTRVDSFLVRGPSRLALRRVA